jgi:hypothetical protein
MKEDISDIFEETFREGEPTFSFDWADALIILGAILFFIGMLIHII